MKSVTRFNSWILGKINGYLTKKEGCVIDRVEYTSDGARTIISDAFGFEYEICIRTLGRRSDGQYINPRATGYQILERIK